VQGPVDRSDRGAERPGDLADSRRLLSRPRSLWTWHCGL